MDASVDPWRRAETFAELCDLGARFVHGELASFPGWGAAELDDESDALVPELELANRAGFLTVASQPGRPFQPGHDGRAWAQRGFVAGFASPAAERALAAAARERSLWWFTGPSEAAPAALADGTPYLFVGHDARAEELELFADALDPRALAALAGCAFGWFVDPVWGRRGALVAALRAAFGSPVPSDYHLGPNTAPGPP